MFKHSGHHKKGGPLASIFRLILSLIIMGVLAVGLLLAYRSFSGVDPLTLSPNAIAKNLLSSEKLYEFVAGLLSANPKDSLSKAKGLFGDQGGVGGGPGSAAAPTAPLSYKFALISDTHNDSLHLRKALAQAKAKDVRYVIGLGDYTDVGTRDELLAAKKEFDSSGLATYLTVGDHDLWDSRDKGLNASDRYKEVFGSPYQSFSYEGVRNIIVYNSDDYLGLDGVELNWLEEELRKSSVEGKLTFVFAHKPFFHPSSDHQMGRVNAKLKNQAAHLISISHKAGVKEVFAGDTHTYSSYQEPTTGLKMTTVGAVTSTRNPQAPRFAIVSVYQDSSYSVEDVVIQ